MRREGGAPFVAAASMEDLALKPPTRAAFAEGARLAGATDLGAASVPSALRALAFEQDFSAMIPVGLRSGEPAALLLVGGADDQRMTPDEFLARIDAVESYRSVASTTP